MMRKPVMLLLLSLAMLYPVLAAEAAPNDTSTVNQAVQFTPNDGSVRNPAAERSEVCMVTEETKETLDEKRKSANRFELFGLNHRAADHITPDAVVRVPAGFDATRPIHLSIYNHGWGSNASSCYSDNQLSAQLDKAPPNTVLVVPEWQQSAAARNGDQGRFKDRNLFRDMLLEIFDKTAPLKGKNLSDVDTITIFAHSAGYGPTETEINNNDGIAAKVINITLLDALYDKFGFDEWLQANIKELASGKKRFCNFFSGTPIYSKAQAGRVEEMLRKSSLPTLCMIKDYDTAGEVMNLDSIVMHPIVFKFSSATVGPLGPHMSMPLLYVGLVESAANKALQTGDGGNAELSPAL